MRQPPATSSEAGPASVSLSLLSCRAGAVRVPAGGTSPGREEIEHRPHTARRFLLAAILWGLFFSSFIKIQLVHGNTLLFRGYNSVVFSELEAVQPSP